MKQSSGFIFIEVLAIFSGIIVLLVVLLKVCGSSVLFLQKSYDLHSAWKYIHSQTSVTDSSFQRIETTEKHGDLKVREVQIIQGEKIICNMVSVE